MNSVQDAIYNWLTIRVVVDHRPEDHAAQETVEWFEKTLKEEHSLADFQYIKQDQWYFVNYYKESQQHELRFPVDLIEVMLNQIQEFPERYNNFFDEE